MAKRSIYKILLPAVRFLAMLHAFVGLIHYEEKDGKFYHGTVRYGKGEFLLSVRDLIDPITIPGLLYIAPGGKEYGQNAEDLKKALESEPPESSAYHIASPRDAERRRKKKIVLTPFGEFTVRNLLQVFRGWGCVHAV